MKQGNEHPNTAEELLRAMKAGSYVRVSRLLNDGVSVNTHLPVIHEEYPGRPGQYLARNNTSPLHLAAAWELKSSQMKLIHRLLNAGADIHATDDQGFTPLHDAACDLRGSALQAIRRGYATTPEQALAPVQAMLDAGADIHARTKQGFTALHLAALYAPTAVAELLIARGSDIHATAGEGETPLHFAAMAGNTELVRILLRAGADVNAREADGMTPLGRAAYYSESADMLRLLAEAGAGLSPRIGKSGTTPLHLAATSGQYENIRTLLELGVDVNQRDNNDNTALLKALAQQHFPCTRLLLESGADTSHNNDSGTHFCLLALSAGHPAPLALAEKYCPAFPAIREAYLATLRKTRLRKRITAILLAAIAACLCAWLWL